MIPDIDINKVLEVALKYKTQLTFLGILFLLVLSFHLGRKSIHIPDLPEKEEYCSEYKGLYNICSIDLDKCNEGCDKRVDESVDVERKSCDVKIANAVKLSKKQQSISNCKIAKLKAKQCLQNEKRVRRNK